ncbi:MAG: SusD/RagB family nutrient-binding outer membrane lipoprotein, partial [Pseudomonadota bacterium]
MKKNKFIKLIVLAGVMITFAITSCKKDFFDINQNPNDPAEAAIEQLLPSAEAAIGLVVGNSFQVFGGLYGQYWTQGTASTQYKNYEQYNPTASDLDNPWKAIYADALPDLNAIIEKATAQQKPNYVACALILKAYSLQLLTDNFGDVPYSEALQGDKNFSPKYDKQQDVYDTIIATIKSGIALIDESSDIHPAADDLLLNGDMAVWRGFANTLLLRVYLRISEVDNAKAAAGITAMDADPDVYFLAEGENVEIKYTSQGGNTNPLSAEMAGLNNTQNLVASKTCVDYLNNNNDLRNESFYDAIASGVVGISQGAYNF